MNKFHYEKEELEPRRATKTSAAYDFISPVDFIINPHSTSDLIDCEVSVELDPDKVLLLFTRSGNGIKRRVTLANNVGVVDSDYYPNHIGTKLVNDSDEPFIVKKGDRIMQGIIMQYFTVDDEEEITTERTSGFGSTGK